MGHSLVQGIVHLVEENGTEQGTYNMSDFFFHPLLLKSNKSFVDNVIRGLVTQPSQAVDHLVTNELRVKLFRYAPLVFPNQSSAQHLLFNRERNARFGFDLVALNTQRGRDHGLPDYNTYRQFCGLSKLAQFSDLISTEGSNLDPLVPIIPPEVKSLTDLLTVYRENLISCERLTETVGRIPEGDLCDCWWYRPLRWRIDGSSDLFRWWTGGPNIRLPYGRELWKTKVRGSLLLRDGRTTSLFHNR